MRKWWLSEHTNAYRVHIPTQRMLIGRGKVEGLLRIGRGLSSRIADRGSPEGVCLKWESAAVYAGNG